MLLLKLGASKPRYATILHSEIVMIKARPASIKYPAISADAEMAHH